MPAQNAPMHRLEHRIPRSIEQLMYGAEQQYNQLPGLQNLQGQYEGLEGERQGLMHERQGINQINQMDPQLQQLAYNAAFAPIQGIQTQLQDAMMMAGNQAASRGLGRSTISGAMQALTIPRVMNPALAQAQGQYSQAMLDLPFQERQLRMQSLGQGMELNQLGMQNVQGQQNLKMSAFDMLQRAQSSAQAQLEFQKSQKGGFGKAIGGLAGGLVGSFLGPVGGAIGSKVGGMIGGGSAFKEGGFNIFDPASSPMQLPNINSMQMSATNPQGSWGSTQPYAKR